MTGGSVMGTGGAGGGDGADVVGPREVDVPLFWEGVVVVDPLGGAFDGGDWGGGGGGGIREGGEGGGGSEGG